jgi:hypothetical protein
MPRHSPLPRARPAAWVLALALALGPMTRTARAQEPLQSPQPQAARYELWLSLSATLLLAGTAGSFALKQAALYDRIALLGPNIVESPRLQEDAVSAERLAWGFGAAASLMAVTSILLLIDQPAAPNDATPTVAPVFSNNQLGVRYQQTF